MEPDFSASPRARGRLNEAGGKVRVQDGVCLLRVQSVRAGLIGCVPGGTLISTGCREHARGVQRLGRAGIRRFRPRRGHHNSPFRE